MDYNLERLLNWEKQIMTDSLSIKDDKELLKFSKTNSSDFNFLKIYEIGRYYRHYLQIRLRYKDYQLIHQFLQKYRTDYEFSRLVNDKLHETTNEIITDYSQKSSVTSHDSLPWLATLFYNENLDGYNRLLAWVRIIFIAHNKRQYDSLAEMFLHFVTLIGSGKLYSRRIITNFYSQYLLYYAAKQDFVKAANYGYLSIKEKNNDYLYYINNLAAFLLRAQRPGEVLEVLKESNAIAKESLNFHNRIGHVAYHIFGLIDSGKSKQAENQAFVFLTAYKKEILENRWHLFFTAYIKAMLLNGNYAGVLKVNNHFRLKDRDLKYRESANYSASIPWMCQIAMYKNGDATLAALYAVLSELKTINIKYSNTNITQDDLLVLTKVVLKDDFVKLGL
ncbi:MAG: hypothetical protein IPO37_24750 [Saprospiraceae bacterium]|nr:hypothetical protein [Saprospiraceae bacterium]